MPKPIGWSGAESPDIRAGLPADDEISVGTASLTIDPTLLLKVLISSIARKAASKQRRPGLRVKQNLPESVLDRRALVAAPTSGTRDDANDADAEPISDRERKDRLLRPKDGQALDRTTPCRRAQFWTKVCPNRTGAAEFVKEHSFHIPEDDFRPGAELFQEAINGFMATRFRIETAERKPLAARMRTYRARRMRCADIWFSPHRTSLIPGGKASVQDPNFLISLQLSGRAIIRQSERETEINPGDFFLIDTASPFEIRTEEVRTKSVYLSRDVLREVIPDIDLCTAVGISSQCGTGRVLRAVVDELFELAPDLDEVAADSFVSMMPHVIAVALDTYRKRPRAASSKLEVFHRERIRAFVKQNLQKADLDCATIAAAVNLSPRYVHALFASQETSLMRWIWSERLERIKRELGTPNLERRQIATIAYDWGFSDPAHFSRVFKSVYHMSPRDYRVSALNASAKALSSQMESSDG